MTLEELIAHLDSLPGILNLAPAPGDPAYPEIAWGDNFFYYAPDGKVPTTTQPFATIITKDYPDDSGSNLNRPNTFRLNIHVGTAAFTAQLGYSPRESATHSTDPSAVDTLFPHPIYTSTGWLSVVNPGPRTASAVNDLLNAAHARARSRYGRRADYRK
ncbi:hypothetical protein GFY24_08545 [Nocardia sp. SYP-A9097]|uniref:DUF6194 family protein n=1 Tax=Nocardia sp. SYP-A9097 TaxID=2663237 RepID=UPI00129B2765|nr:DUF6194 family protein [Nocardia sp. SYP-A9097]MRH87503.1 hypothetical protein [Nocardia sp. SYP-A9097]